MSNRIKKHIRIYAELAYALRGFLPLVLHGGLAVGCAAWVSIAPRSSRTMGSVVEQMSDSCKCDLVFA